MLSCCISAKSVKLYACETERKHPSVQSLRYRRQSTKIFAFFCTVESKFSKSSSRAKLKLKAGGVVDPEVEEEHDLHDVHVYKEGNGGGGKTPDGCLWAATLSNTNLSRGTNAYYKLQLLEGDGTSQYWLFRSWGRIGTTIGGNKLEQMGLQDAKCEFERLFLEKTGNRWDNRLSFQKRPDKMVMLDIDYESNNTASTSNGDAVDSKVVRVAGERSSLSPEVQQLLTKIFDIKAMCAAMKEFEIDLQKMPLGKISRNQILKAYEVLTELDKKLKRIKKVELHAAPIQGASNKFYTLIPHDTSIHMPPQLSTPEIVKSKMDMLDSLLDMEIAFNIIDAAKAEIAAGQKDPLDVYYEKMHCRVEPLSPDSEEFLMIDKYVQQTHGRTHSTYKLRVQYAFRVDRELEFARFNSHSKDFPNKMLLWHGSRLTNFGTISLKMLTLK